ncbi:hypothetical protein HanIR_Chr07g0340541 [Helianthus annuus]|nr:hypothetical protein HanIR_Chr07g0340541 [Helianthus annuus]
MKEIVTKKTSINIYTQKKKKKKKKKQSKGIHKLSNKSSLELKVQQEMAHRCSATTTGPR